MTKSALLLIQVISSHACMQTLFLCDDVIYVKTQRAADCCEHLNNRMPVQLLGSDADSGSNTLRFKLEKKKSSQFLTTYNKSYIYMYITKRFSGHGGGGMVVGLDVLSGLFQP